MARHKLLVPQPDCDEIGSTQESDRCHQAVTGKILPFHSLAISEP